MKEKNSKKFVLPVCLTVITLIYTVLVRTVNVEAIGPQGTSVGFAAINGAVHNAIGVHMLWYKITQALGLFAIFVFALFALQGFIQLIKRKSLFKVDRSIISLGIIFAVLFALYVIFEILIINYRPVIMPGETEVEASFPSSHTMLAYTVFGCVIIYFKKFLSGKSYSKIIMIVSLILIFLMLFGRLFSGVHWLTDIVGGVLYSAVLLAFFNVMTE